MYFYASEFAVGSTCHKALSVSDGCVYAVVPARAVRMFVLHSQKQGPSVGFAAISFAYFIKMAVVGIPNKLSEFKQMSPVKTQPLYMVQHNVHRIV